MHGLFDMRIPLLLTDEDIDIIGTIVHEEMVSAVSG